MRLYVPPLEGNTMEEAKRPQTVVEVEAEINRLRAWLKEVQFLASYVIEDYPIGRTARGRCKLEVEFKKGKGWRTVKTTTNKMGKWCKPHCSTYHEGYGVVVTHPDLAASGKEAGWLTISMGGVGVLYAGDGSLRLAAAPYYCKPRRTEERYKIVTRTMKVFSGEEPTETETEHVSPADPPALCDAYDLWHRSIMQLVQDVAARVNDLRKAV
jgi:hypothetical protein